MSPFCHFSVYWASASHRKVGGNYETLILRFVLIVCLLYLDFGAGYELICELLSLRHVTEKLPKGINQMLRWISTSHPEANLNMFAESFKKVGNPLVVASLGGNCPKCPSSAVFVDMTSKRSIDDVFGLFFYQKDAAEARESVGSSTDQLWDTLDILLPSGNQVEGEIHPSTKIEIEKAIHLLSNRMDQNPPDEQSRRQLAKAASTMDALKQLHSMLDLSGINSSIIGELVKKANSRRVAAQPRFGGKW